MKISTKAAMPFAVIVGAQQKSESSYIPLRDIANRQGIDIKYLEQIVSLLKKRRPDPGAFAATTADTA